MKYLLLSMFLTGCKLSGPTQKPCETPPKFTAGQFVVVTDSFYKGCNGTVEDYSGYLGCDYLYTVLLWKCGDAGFDFKTKAGLEQHQLEILK